MMETLIGSRVRLIHTDDPYTILKPGAEGIVSYIDHLGTVFVAWDDESNLGLIKGEDQWEVIPGA
jgi:hypothetical protein